MYPRTILCCLLVVLSVVGMVNCGGGGNGASDTNLSPNNNKADDTNATNSSPNSWFSCFSFDDPGWKGIGRAYFRQLEPGLWAGKMSTRRFFGGYSWTSIQQFEGTREEWTRTSNSGKEWTLERITLVGPDVKVESERPWDDGWDAPLGAMDGTIQYKSKTTEGMICEFRDDVDYDLKFNSEDVQKALKELISYSP
jgi:hypothetical protein